MTALDLDGTAVSSSGSTCSGSPSAGTPPALLSLPFVTLLGRFKTPSYTVRQVPPSHCVGTWQRLEFIPAKVLVGVEAAGGFPHAGLLKFDEF